MAVSTTGKPSLTALPVIDRRYPDAIWRAGLSVVGDLTGGVAIGTLQLSSGSAYSLEGIWFNLGSGVSISIDVNTGEEIPTFTGAVQKEFVMSAVVAGSASPDGSTRPAEDRLRGMYGVRFRPSTIFDVAGSRITFNVPNANLVTFIFTGWGFRWDLEGYKLPGGLHRPGDTPVGGWEAITDKIEAGLRTLPIPGVIASPYGSKLK